MFDRVTHTVESKVDDPIRSVTSLLLSDKKGKLVSFPVIWASGKKGHVAVYTGSIYKITDVEGGYRGNQCKVYFVDSTDEQRKYENGSTETTFTMDEVIKLIND